MLHARSSSYYVQSDLGINLVIHWHEDGKNSPKEIEELKDCLEAINGMGQE